MNVLIVDDDPLVIMLMERFLTICEFPEPRSFPNGLAALNYLASPENSQQKHLVFLDLNMPEMNGWEFLSAIRTRGFFQKNILVYIITSSVDPMDRSDALADPFVRDYLVKPVLGQHLERIKLDLGL